MKGGMADQRIKQNRSNGKTQYLFWGCGSEAHHLPSSLLRLKKMTTKPQKLINHQQVPEIESVELYQ